MATNSLPQHTSNVGLTLATLGRVAVQLSRDAGDPELIPLAGKQLGIIVYLACAPGRSAHRDHLINQLWGNLPMERGRERLRSMLTEIRAKIGEDCFGPPKSDPLVLTTPLHCDRDELLEAWKAGDYKAVVELYAGEFLPRLDGLSAAGFAQWVDGEREHLRRIFLHAGLELVQRALLASRPREALQMARHVRDHDELGEASWRALLQAVIATGDPIVAATEGERLRSLIEAGEFEPEQATLDLLDRARNVPNVPNAERTTRRETALVADLVGRETEISKILRHWDHARSTSMRCVHVVAPAGLGKTRLLNDLRARLHAVHADNERVRTVYARAHHGAREFPYALVGDLARGLVERRARISEKLRTPEIPEWASRALVALNPTLSEFYPTRTAELPTGDDFRRHVVPALHELIKAVVVEGSLAILLDDLHWSHVESRRLLAAVFARTDRLRVLVVSASRTGGDCLCAADISETLTLGSLTVDSVAELLASLASLPDPPWDRQLPHALHESTAGSPLLVLETLHLLMEQELLVHSRAGWTVVDARSLSEGLTSGSALRRRVHSLGVGERRVLLVLAVCGVALPESTVASATGRTAAELRPVLSSLEERGLVIQRNDEWTPGHDEHAAAVLDHESVPAQRRAAADAGRAIAETAGESVARLRLAAPLLAQGGAQEFPVLARAFEQIVRAQRLARDRRSDTALAREVLGSQSNETLATALAGSLPWWVRARLVSAGRVAVVIGVLLFIATTLAAWLLRPLPRPPTAVLAAYWPSDDGKTDNVVEIPVQESEWRLAPIEVDVKRTRRRQVAAAALGVWGLRPDGQGWIGERPVPPPDSGELSIFDLPFNGEARRLTFGPGDDSGPSFSPDGSQFAFATSQWKRSERYDLAVEEVLTGRVRQLTRDEDGEAGPRWSPDGSRIAFMKRFWHGQRAVCVTDTDGTGTRCLEPGQGPAASIYGWIDEQHLLIQIEPHGQRHLSILDLTTGTDSVLSQPGGNLSLSPDGRWVLCQCGETVDPAESWILYRLDRPNDSRRLRVVGSRKPELVSFTWSPRSPRRHYLAQMNLLSAPGEPIVGIPYQLRVATLDQSGSAIDPGVIRWRSVDTTIATIDASGMLTARRAGRAQIEASAGGWRTRTTTLPCTSLRTRHFSRRTGRTDSRAGSVSGIQRPTSSGMAPSALPSTTMATATTSAARTRRSRSPRTRDYGWRPKSRSPSRLRPSRIRSWSWPAIRIRSAVLRGITFRATCAS